MKEDDDYVKALLKLAVERGIPVLYRDSDGYMKAITKENLSKIGSEGLSNLHVDMNSMKDVIETIEHDSGMIAGKYVPKDFVHDGEVQSVGNATFSGEDKLFDGSLDTYMQITSDKNNLPSGVIITLPKPILAKSIIVHKVKNIASDPSIHCTATEGEVYFDFSFFDNEGNEIQYNACKCTEYSNKVVTDTCGCTGNSIATFTFDKVSEIAKIKVVQIHTLHCPMWGLKRIDVETTPYIEIIDSSGAYINPAKDETLSQIDIDFNTKIPRPFTFDSNGNLIVNTQLTAIKIEDSSSTVINPAKDETVQALKPKDDHFVAEIDVGTDAVQVDTDALIRDEITIYADKNNSDVTYLGNSDGNLPFPLNAGDILAIKKASLSKIWLKANSGTQKIYIDAGGGW